MTNVKRIAQVLAFFLGLIIILWALSIVFFPKNNMENFGMEEVKANGILGEKENTIDIVVIGDSEAYSSISSMELWRTTGYTSYVCGSSAQPLNYSFKMLQRAFSKQSPKIVILETNTIFRNVNIKNTVLTKLGDHFAIFDYNDRWKKMKFQDIFKSSDYTWTDDTKGYRFSTVVSPSQKSDHMAETDAYAKIAKTNLYLIEQIKDYCDEHQAELLFLSTPSTLNWNYARHNSVQKLADDLDCTYIDLNLLNDVVRIDWSKDTRDKGDHLNHSGAVKVTQYLSAYLKRTNLFSDHREEKEYQDWNESLERYLKQIQENVTA